MIFVVQVGVVVFEISVMIFVAETEFGASLYLENLVKLGLGWELGLDLRRQFSVLVIEN